VPLLPVRVPDISLDRNKGFEHWEMLSEEASRSHGDEIYCTTTGIKSVSGQRQMLWAGPTEAPRISMAGAQLPHLDQLELIATI